jgi:septum formation protein
VPRLILASTSPRRRELIAEAGYTAEIIAPHPGAECGVCSRETPPEFVARMAYQKAADVAGRVAAKQTADRQHNTIVIGCDTVAECAGQILGKPSDVHHARTMLQLLSGRVHHVYSGLCLWLLPAGEPHVQVERTTLRMDRLSETQLDEYLASGLWEGKAGAFGYQDRVGWLRIVEGSESNVVGLPLELLRRMLGELKAADSA